MIQPIEIIKSEADGSKTLVVYSMGNFLSNQRYEFLGNRYTEDGIIVNITVRKNINTQEISVAAIRYVPTWVHKHTVDGRRVYEIVPLLDALLDNQTFNLETEDSIWRADNSLQNTTEIIHANAAAVFLAPAISQCYLSDQH